MSDVKRYIAFIGADGQFVQHGDPSKRVYGGHEVVLASDYDALQSQVAALRDDAKKMRDDERYYGSDYTNSMHFRDRDKLLNAILSSPATSGKQV